MDIQIFKGCFEANDAIDLISQVIHIKIKFHERKINDLSSEEDIKIRENRIKQLQKELYDARTYIEQRKGNISIESEIQVK